MKYIYISLDEKQHLQKIASPFICPFFHQWLFCGFFHCFLLESTSKAVYLGGVFIDSEPVIWVLSPFNVPRGERQRLRPSYQEIQVSNRSAPRLCFDSNGSSGELMARSSFSWREEYMATREATSLIGSWKKKEGRHSRRRWPLSEEEHSLQVTK